jgi:hypothetical protein
VADAQATRSVSRGIQGVKMLVDAGVGHLAVCRLVVDKVRE